MSFGQGYSKGLEAKSLLGAFTWPYLETDSLALRPLSLNDAEDMFEYAQDPRVSQYLSWEPHISPEASGEFLRGVLARYIQGVPAPWGIEHRSDQKLIGTCGFLSCNLTHHYADIGYLLAPSYWYHGYATEAARAIIDYGFRELALHRIEAQCRIENQASARVMEKVGMRTEGVLRGRFYLQGQWHDSHMYSITRDDIVG